MSTGSPGGSLASERALKLALGAADVGYEIESAVLILSNGQNALHRLGTGDLRSAFVVTVIAGRRGVVGPMALHASRHRNVTLAGNHVPFPHRAVAGFTRGFRPSQMYLVTEIDEIRELVDANPGYRLALFVKFGKLLNAGAVFLNGSMTDHALGGFRQNHLVT